LWRAVRAGLGLDPGRYGFEGVVLVGSEFGHGRTIKASGPIAKEQNMNRVWTEENPA
jgi:hypothetical protein